MCTTHLQGSCSSSAPPGICCRSMSTGFASFPNARLRFTPPLNEWWDNPSQVVCVLVQRWSVCIPLRSGRDCQTHSLQRQNPATFRPSPASNRSRLLSSCVWKREWTWQQGWSNHVSMGQHDCSLVWFTLTPKLVSNPLRFKQGLAKPHHFVVYRKQRIRVVYTVALTF